MSQFVTAPNKLESLIGQRLNNFEIKSLIGEGGMGAVFVAQHSLIDRKVAVKVLRPELAQDANLVQRFLNEARAVNALRHPNIIEIVDVGTMPDDGLPYIVMELLQGHSLADEIKRRGRIPVRAAIEILAAAASAVGAAHARGIVHRDLKPDNLFVVGDPQGRSRTVKVLDFGIAKLSADLSGNSQKTATGSLLGTPAYRSPEQCMGVSADVDHRTDVYSLGVILFEMLCGSPPFVAAGFGEVLMKHMSEPPARPSSKNPLVPKKLEQAILKALAKKREDRFDTMADFATALHGIGLTMAELEAAGTLGAAPPAPSQRRRLVVGAGVVAVALVALAILFGRGAWQGGPQAARPSGLPAQQTATPGAPARPEVRPLPSAAAAPAPAAEPEVKSHAVPRARPAVAVSPPKRAAVAPKRPKASRSAAPRPVRTAPVVESPRPASPLIEQAAPVETRPHSVTPPKAEPAPRDNPAPKRKPLVF